MTEPATPVDLLALRAGTLAALLQALVTLDEEQLAALLQAETADAAPRAEVIEAIELHRAHLADAAKDNPASAAAPPPSGEVESARLADKAEREAAEAAAAGPPAPWKEPDYTGPLTGPQGTWRNAHLKRFDPEAAPASPKSKSVKIDVQVSPGRSSATAGQVARAVAAKAAGKRS